MDRARCPLHGLIVPNGARGCVRCRHDASSDTDRGADGRTRLVLALIVGLPLVAIGGARVVTSVRDHVAAVAIAAPPEVQHPARPVTSTPAAPATGAAATSTAATSTAAQREQLVQTEMKNVSVTVYAADYCPWCRKAKAHLDERGIAYLERKVDVSPEAKRDMARLGGHGIPTIDVEGDVHSGYDPGWIDHTVRAHAEQRVALLSP